MLAIREIIQVNRVITMAMKMDRLHLAGVIAVRRP